MNLLFKIIGWFFALLFIVSALLQYNDPDPLVWIIIWGVAAIIAAVFAMNRVAFIVPLVMGVLCLVGFIYVFPDKFEGFEIGNGDIVNIERGREAFGLLIIAITMLSFAMRTRYVNRLKV